MDFSEIIKRCTVAQCPILKNVPSNKYRMNLKEKNSIASFLFNQLRSDKFYKFFFYLKHSKGKQFQKLT